jgi:hypothetical protein
MHVPLHDEIERYALGDPRHPAPSPPGRNESDAGSDPASSEAGSGR